MSVKQTESKITALYERLSRDDDNAGDTLLQKLPLTNPISAHPAGEIRKRKGLREHHLPCG